MKWNPYFFSYYAKKVYVFVKENFLLLFLFTGFSIYMIKEIYLYFNEPKQTEDSSIYNSQESFMGESQILKESIFSLNVSKGSDLLLDKTESFLEENQTQLSEDKICVFLSGNVHKSGKYLLPKEESTLKDLLLKAGGMKEDYSDFLFMEKSLSNNEAYYLPSAEEVYEVLSKIKKGKYPWWWKKDLYRLEEQELEKQKETNEKTESCFLTDGIVFQTFPQHINDLPLNERQKVALKEYLKNNKIEKLEDFLQVEGIGEKSLQKLQACLVYEIP